MGFLDNLPFGKKKDNFSVDSFKDPFPNQTFSSPQDPLLVQPSQNYGSPPSYPVSPYPQGSPLYPSQNAYPSQSADQFSSSNASREMELIRAKIDAVQATLESLNSRFASIERYINESAKKRW